MKTSVALTITQTSLEDVMVKMLRDDGVKKITPDVILKYGEKAFKLRDKAYKYLIGRESEIADILTKLY